MNSYWVPANYRYYSVLRERWNFADTIQNLSWYERGAKTHVQSQGISGELSACPRERGPKNSARTGAPRARAMFKNAKQRIARYQRTGIVARFARTL